MKLLYRRQAKGTGSASCIMLAGMSIDYYIRLERGNLSGASESVLEALARALQLDDAETAHLFDLARAATTGPRVRRKRSSQTVRPSAQRVIEAITTAPAWVRNDRGDVLAANELGRALYLDLMADRPAPPNSARFKFDKDLADLIGELSTRSEEFRTRWARHDVKHHRTGRKRLDHPSWATSTSPTKRSSFPRPLGSGSTCTPQSGNPPQRTP